MNNRFITLSVNRGMLRSFCDAYVFIAHAYSLQYCNDLSRIAVTFSRVLSVLDLFIRARTFHTELYFTTNVVANTHIYTFTYDN